MAQPNTDTGGEFKALIMFRLEPARLLQVDWVSDTRWASAMGYAHGPENSPPVSRFRVTRGHFDQEQPERVVARHVAAVSTPATDFCDTKSGGILLGRGMSQNS